MTKLPRPSWPGVWIAAIRPRTLPLSMTPIVAGCVLGWLETGLLRFDVFISALLTSVAIQIGANLHNDAIDSLNGTDGDARVGPTRVTQQGWLSAKTVIGAAHAAFFVALLCGLYLVWLGGWPLLALGAVSILAGYAYSAGPWPLTRYPFAELFVLIFFGFVAVCGTAYIYSGAVSPAAVALGFAVGLPACAVLLVNNTRDMESDALAGRKTLSILMGRRGSSKLYGWFVLGGLIAATAMAMIGPRYFGAVGALACFPFAVRNIRAFRTASGGAAFNASLARTAAYQVSLSVSLCLGLIVLNFV